MRMNFIIISLFFILFTNSNANLPSYFIYDSSNSPFKYNHIEKVIVDNNDNIWILNYDRDTNNQMINKIYQYDRYKWKLLEDNPYISSLITISDLKVSKTGSVYVTHNSSRFGLFKYSDGQWTQFMNGDSTNGWNGINVIILMDRDNLMLGTWRGILFTDSSFKYINSYVPPRINTGYFGIIWEILLLEDGNIWFTDTGEQGLYHAKIDSNYNVILIDWYNKENSILDYFNIFNLVIDKYDNICFNAVKKDLTTYHSIFIKKDSINIFHSSENSENALKIHGTDKNGSLWCSMPEKLIQYDLKYNILETYGPFNNTFPKCNIYSMAYDSKNNLWFGTDIGLVVFNSKGLQDINDVEVKNRINNFNRDFSISPNPATDYIDILSSLSESSGVLYSPSLRRSGGIIKIYNTLGECVLTTPSLRDTPSEKGNLRVDVSGLPSGVYFVRLGDWVGRFVKI